MRVEDGHWFVQTDVSSLDLLRGHEDELIQRVQYDHSRQLAEAIRPLMRFHKEYRIETDSNRYISDVYAFSPEQMQQQRGMKQQNYDQWGKQQIMDRLSGQSATKIWIDDVTDSMKIKTPAEESDYTNDADAAMAWRELWKKLVKYNKKIAKQTIDVKATAGKVHWRNTPLDRALAEVERLQALDRTLARRLKG